LIVKIVELIIIIIAYCKYL